MTIERLVSRLGAQTLVASAASLEWLQRRWIMQMPFHNLDVLAGWATGSQPFGPDESVERCALGLGGACHVHASAFLSVLQACGFNAELAGAEISHANDHLLVRAECEGEWLCDVGNGQPYLRPFAMSESRESSHLGWVVRSTPVDGGVLVERSSPDQTPFRRVYVARNQSLSWEDFAPQIHRHHHELGFGPFLSGLRATVIREHEMIALRDDVVTRYRPSGFVREQLNVAETRCLLIDELGLSSLPVDLALEAWLAGRQK